MMGRTAQRAMVLVCGAALMAGSAGAASAVGRADVASTVHGQAPQASATALVMPRPTGRHRTGTTLIHLRNAHRIDTLDPSRRPRELMLQLWYPAAPNSNQPFAAYAAKGEVEAMQGMYPVPKGGFDRQTFSRMDAPVAGGRHKVVFFSHGLCANRTDGTVIAEQLASQGYIVASAASTHESTAVQFPDGRVERPGNPDDCFAGGDPFSAKGVATLKRLLGVRVQDTSWLLDQLDAINRGHNPDADAKPLPAGLPGALLTRHVGIFGHSFGGGTAAQVMSKDRRFVAGADLDGMVNGDVASKGLDQPFLVLGSSYHDLKGDPTLAQFLPRLRGWHRWFQLPRAGHYRFMDLAGSPRKWRLDTSGVVDPATWEQIFGDLQDRTAQRLVTTATVSFFDHFLSHQPMSQALQNLPAHFPGDVKDMTNSVPPAPRHG